MPCRPAFDFSLDHIMKTFAPIALLLAVSSLHAADSGGSAHAAVCMDLNHSSLRENLETAAAGCAELIANIHVSDNRGEKEDHLIPGEGVLDFVPAMRALRAAGYSGPVNLECHLPSPPDVATLVRLRKWAEHISAQSDIKTLPQSQGAQS